jgi:N utilization substance protein B
VKNVTIKNTPQKRSVGREYAFKFIYKHLLSDFVREKNLIISDTKSFEDALNMFDLSYYEEDTEHPDNIIDAHTKVFARVRKKRIQNSSRNILPMGTLLKLTA